MYEYTVFPFLDIRYPQKKVYGKDELKNKRGSHRLPALDVKKNLVFLKIYGG
jgi:hypothetical protein